MARSPLIYFGGKSKVAKTIINMMPPHKCYVEPFGGAGHVLAQKEPTYCDVYNDIDDLIGNFILMVRDDPDKMAKACSSLPYARRLYYEWRDQEPPEDQFERAVWFFFLNRAGVAKGNGPSGRKTGFRHSAKMNPARTYHSAIEEFQAFAERMKFVIIENSDFENIFRVYDGPDTLFYVDPPYIGREKYYAGEWDENKHRKLAEVLQKVKGKVVLSYYDDPLLLELYPNWYRERFEAYKQVVNGDNCYAEELLLLNFPRQFTIDDLL